MGNACSSQFPAHTGVILCWTAPARHGSTDQTETPGHSGRGSLLGSSDGKEAPLCPRSPLSAFLTLTQLLLQHSVRPALIIFPSFLPSFLPSFSPLFFPLLFSLFLLRKEEGWVLINLVFSEHSLEKLIWEFEIWNSHPDRHLINYLDVRHPGKLYFLLAPVNISLEFFLKNSFLHISLSYLILST